MKELRKLWYQYAAEKADKDNKQNKKWQYEFKAVWIGTAAGVIQNKASEKLTETCAACVKYFDFSIKYKLGRVNANKPISE